MRAWHIGAIGLSIAVASCERIAAPSMGADSGLRPPPLAAAVTLTVERVRLNQLYLPEATVLIENGAANYLDIYVDCSFLAADGGLVGTGSSNVYAVAPGASARENVLSAEQYARFEAAECRVAGARISR